MNICLGGGGENKRERGLYMYIWGTATLFKLNCYWMIYCAAPPTNQMLFHNNHTTFGHCTFSCQMLSNLNILQLVPQ